MLWDESGRSARGSGPRRDSTDRTRVPISGRDALFMGFFENVAGIRSLPEVWGYILRNSMARGFTVRWVTVEASHVGIPMRRARWFCLAIRGESRRPWVDELPVDLKLEPHVWGPRTQIPDARDWMVTGDEPGCTQRLSMCGNAVVPIQAFLAARLLASATRF